MAQKSLEVLGGGLGQSLQESETYPKYALRHTGTVKKTYERAFSDFVLKLKSFL